MVGNLSLGCLEVSSVCRVFQPEDVRAGSACVCDCWGELMRAAQELKDVSSCQREKKRVGFGKEEGLVLDVNSIKVMLVKERDSSLVPGQDPVVQGDV